MGNCSAEDVQFLMVLKDTFAFNQSAWDKVINGNHGCNRGNTSYPLFPDQSLGSHSDEMQYHHHNLLILNIGLNIHGYITPIIVLVGVLGNGISLKVFSSKFMRRLSSSYYLVMLSAADFLVLLSYVLFDWLDKGLPRWPVNNRLPVVNYPGACRVFLYMAYTLRLLSVWLMVALTAERFVAICYPNKRKAVCSKPFARRCIFVIVLIVCLLCIYKPILSGVYPTNVNHQSKVICTRHPDYDDLNFILESFYGLLITGIPLLIISGLSLPIFRKLRTRKQEKNNSQMVFRENRIRLEFTVILLAISWCFIALTLPYFVTWCQQFRQSLRPASIQSPMEMERMRGQNYITRTISYIKYCINFFLYCMTGAYYRREIRSILKFRMYFRKDRYPTMLNR